VSPTTTGSRYQFRQGLNTSEAVFGFSNRPCKLSAVLAVRFSCADPNRPAFVLSNAAARRRTSPAHWIRFHSRARFPCRHGDLRPSLPRLPALPRSRQGLLRALQESEAGTHRRLPLRSNCCRVDGRGPCGRCRLRRQKEVKRVLFSPMIC
jgi:hypothetical protein